MSVEPGRLWSNYQQHLIDEERLRQMRTDAGDERLLSTIEGMSRMTDVPEATAEEPGATLTITPVLDPAELEKLKAIGDSIKQVVDGFRAMMVALAPVMRQAVEVIAKIQAEHGDLLKLVEDWEVTESGTTAVHKPTSSVVPIDVARASIERELERRRTTVYETEVEPPCGREDCPSACDGSCKEGVEEADEDEEPSNECVRSSTAGCTGDPLTCTNAVCMGVTTNG